MYLVPFSFLREAPPVGSTSPIKGSGHCWEWGLPPHGELLTGTCGIGGFSDKATGKLAMWKM